MGSTVTAADQLNWFAQHPLREPIHSRIPAAGLIPIFATLISRSLTAGIVNVENRFSLRSIVSR